MYEAAMANFPSCDAAILAAAVADYAPEVMHSSKIKREKQGAMELKLVPNPDIAASLGKIRTESQTLIGFALETENGESNALDKLHRKGLDWIVLNSATREDSGFGVDTNHVTVYGVDGSVNEIETKSKTNVACDIIDLTLG